MLRGGILNPHMLSLLARVRHTNRLVVADRGFPSWPGVETIDLSLVDDVPTVRQVLAAIVPVFVIAEAFMAEEFRAANGPEAERTYRTLLGPDVPLRFEPHAASFKPRVPGSIGIIRTGDTTQYGNIILVSG